VDTPVIVSVDGLILEYPDGSFAAERADLPAGQHVVEVHSVAGRPLTAASIRVGERDRIDLRYQRGKLVPVGQGWGGAAPRAPMPLAIGGP
jgi:hypothetical protein